MIGNIWNAGDYRTWPTYGLIFLWECGHLLAMHWRYIIGATLILCYYFSVVLAGLRAVCKSHGHREHSLCFILLQRLSIGCRDLQCSALLLFLCAYGFILCKSLLVSFALGLRPVCNSTWPFSMAYHCCAKLRLCCCWLCSFFVVGFGEFMCLLYC